jgi:hypothetical protein
MKLLIPGGIKAFQDYFLIKKEYENRVKSFHLVE